MPQFRKTLFSLGGPEYIADPRVAEAQGWAQLQQADRAQQRAVASQAMQAALESDAAERRALLEAEATDRRSLRESETSERGDALKWDLARLHEQNAMDQTRLKEQGWTRREEMRLGSAEDLAEFQANELYRRLKMEQDAIDARTAADRSSREGLAGADRASAEKLALMALLAKHSESGLSLKDRISLGEQLAPVAAAVDEADTPEKLQAAWDTAGQFGPEGQKMLAARLDSRRRQLAEQYQAEHQPKEFDMLSPMSTWRATDVFRSGVPGELGLFQVPFIGPFLSALLEGAGRAGAAYSSAGARGEDFSKLLANMDNTTRRQALAANPYLLDSERPKPTTIRPDIGAAYQSPAPAQGLRLTPAQEQDPQERLRATLAELLGQAQDYEVPELLRRPRE